MANDEDEYLEEPRITFAMIAKDEESGIERCLRSVKDFVDEMIVVDTGSTDRTVEIAESMGARVIRHEWKNDFAQARNVYLREASGHWVLVLDADEELDPRAPAVLGKCARMRTFQGKVCVYFLQERSYLGENPQEISDHAIEHFIARFVPVDPEVYYSGVIHESVFHRRGPDAISSIAVKDAIIHHYGYSSKEQVRKDRLTRNEPLLRRAVDLEPENPYVHFNYALFLYDAGRKAEALPVFERCRELIPEGANPPYRASSLIFPALSALDGDRIDEALALLQEAVRVAPGMPDAHYALGRVYLLAKSEAKALQHFEEAVKAKADIPTYFGISDVGASTWKPCVEMGSLHAEGGRWEQALHWFRRAHGFIPSLKIIVTDMGLCAYRLGRLQEALSLWDESYPEGFSAAPVRIEYVNALWAFERTEDAMRILDEGLGASPEDSSLLLRKAQLLRESGKAALAVDILSFHLKDTPSSPFFLERGLSYHAIGDRDRAMLDFASSVETDPENYMAWNNLGAGWLALGDFPRAAECFVRTLSLKPDYPYALSNLARVHMIAGDYGQALPLLEKSIEKDKSNPRALKLLRAECLLGAGRPDEAEEAARDLSAEDPVDMDAAYLLARSLAARGAHEEAYGQYEKIIERHPERLELYQEAGQLLLAAGRFQEAVALIDKGLNPQQNTPSPQDSIKAREAIFPEDSNKTLSPEGRGQGEGKENES
jgi:tetratricopeptide (TPR) repeat protein